MESLAPEIILAIIAQLADLATLNNFLRASPHASRVFSQNALDAIESIISSPHLDSRAAELIRVIVLVRASALPFATLDSFRSNYALPSLRRQGARPETAFHAGRDSLRQRPLPPGVLRSVVGTAHRLHVLTRSCLAHFLSRANAARPLHRLTGKGYSYRSRGAGPPWQREIPGTPVDVRDAGPPSWVEEQRVVLGFWRVQLACDIQRAAARCNTLGWPLEDVETVTAMTCQDLWETSLPNYSPSAELDTIVGYLAELMPREGSVAWRMPWPPDGPSTVEALSWDPRLPEPDCLASLPSTSIRHSDAFDWGQTREALCVAAPGMSLFYNLSNDQLSPIRGVRFDPFRRIGVALWDRRRMHLLGLLNGIDGPAKQPEYYYFAWRSLLSLEELAEAVEVSKRLDRSYG
jgi:hypothetical protein